MIHMDAYRVGSLLQDAQRLLQGGGDNEFQMVRRLLEQAQTPSWSFAPIVPPTPRKRSVRRSLMIG